MLILMLMLLLMRMLLTVTAASAAATYVGANTTSSMHAGVVLHFSFYLDWDDEGACTWTNQML